MARVTDLGGGTFEVVLHERKRSWFGADTPPPPMDPHRVGLAILAVLGSCREQAVDGRLILWNEFRVFLNNGEFHHMRPMIDLTVSGLDQLVDTKIREMNALQVGRTVIRISVDRDQDVPAGTLRVRCDRVRDPDIAGDRDGEVTIRAGKSPPRPRVEAATQGVAEVGVVRVLWGAGHVAGLAAGAKVFLGRPHDEQRPFVALVGANDRINSLHISLEVGQGSVILQRLPNANPVTVDGAAVQPGGKVEISTFPSTILLSHDFELKLVKP